MGGSGVGADLFNAGAIKIGAGLIAGKERRGTDVGVGVGT